MLNAPLRDQPLSKDLFLSSGIDIGALKRIVLAVSGGGDSTALLYLVHEHWVQALDRDPSDLCVVTVNHGVRDRAVEEADAVGSWCRKLGLSHRMVDWDGKSVATGFQSAARNARYEKLAEVAREFENAVVLTGHTLDDQLETLAMRRARRADGPGMAGIPAATLYERKIWFARPLLHIRRQDLRIFLQARGLQWFEDPSNLDPAYERVRVRLDPTQDERNMLGLASDAAQLRMRNAAEASAWMVENARLMISAGGKQVVKVQYDALHEPGALTALAYLLMFIGHQSQAPISEKTERAIDTLNQRRGASFTVSGCALCRGDDGVLIQTETRNHKTGGFGLNHLLPNWELEILRAIDQMRGVIPVSRPFFCRFD